MDGISVSSKSRILTFPEIQAKLRRMAYEIYEENCDEEMLVMVGINERGMFIARLLKAELEKISSLSYPLFHAESSSSKGETSIHESAEAASLIMDKRVLLVDDVLYSGRTLFHTLAEVMHLGPKAVQAAMLIDRGHRNVPVSPDFVGLELATTLKEHVSVEVQSEPVFAEAFLI